MGEKSRASKRGSGINGNRVADYNNKRVERSLSLSGEILAKAWGGARVG